MNQHILTILFASSAVILGVVVIMASLRKYRQEMDLKGQDQEKTPDVSFIINAFQDVTRQLKEKEKELQRLKALAELRAETVESLNENILQCVSNGVITFDQKGKVQTMNRAAEELLGASRTAAIGTGCPDLFGNSDICSAVQETFDNKVPTIRMETALERDGGRLWLGFNTALLTDRQGERQGVILSFSDLTDIKRLQEQVELKERLTALGEMSAGIAHELRNPMAVISGYLNLLSKDQDEQGRAIIGDVQMEIATMNRIIGDLLTFARPAALNSGEVNLGELLSGCVASVLQAGGGGEIRILEKMENAVILADEGLLRQAFCNLIQNAADAMPDGGTITLESRREGGKAEVRISDTGIGIPQETIQRIFLPFFTTKDRGVGMGLALVHKIVVSHGGTIVVDSGKGRGTTFTITLPVG
ncbi:MAG: ATP-binding protein [Nitrospirota bacterium]|nr:ATP-binding protein [Nitrospirota bacterium]